MVSQHNQRSVSCSLKTGTVKIKNIKKVNFWKKSWASMGVATKVWKTNDAELNFPNQSKKIQIQQYPSLVAILAFLLRVYINQIVLIFILIWCMIFYRTPIIAEYGQLKLYNNGNIGMRKESTKTFTIFFWNF